MKKIFSLFAAVLMTGSMMAVNLLTTVDSVACWSQPGWGSEQYTNFVTYADGSINVAVPGACNAAWQCQVKVHTSGVTLDPAKNYTFSCSMQSSAAFGGVTVKMWDNLELSLKTDVELVAGPNTYTSAAFAGRTDENNGVIVFDFGYAPAGATVVISNIAIEESSAPVVADPKPTTAPAAPTAAATTVLSVYSDTYEAVSAAGFCESWGQSTALETLDLDGNHVLYYKNFNYLGWQIANPIDASTCTGLHMDIWAGAAGSLRVFPIYGGAGKKTDDSHFKEVTLAEGWNSVDFDLATDFAGLNLESIFQFKFDQGAAQQYAFDNVYFTGYTVPAVTYTTLADVRNCAADSIITLKDFEVTYAPASDTRYYYIKDATASCVIYKSNYGLAAGDKVAKGMEAKVAIYKGLYVIVPITEKNDLTITTGEPAAPALATAAPAVADQSKYVIYKNVRVLADTAFVSSAKNTVYAIMGFDTIMFYNNFKIAAELKADSLYNITAVNSVYNNPQVLPISVETVRPAEDECAGEHGLFDAANASINSTYFATGDGWAANPGCSAEISNGVITMHVDQPLVGMWQGQVFVDPGFTFEAGKAYHYEFDVVSTGKVCMTVKVNDSDNDAFYVGAFYDFNIGGGTFHFSTDSVFANENLVAGKGPLIFGFGWTDGNQDVIIKCIKITEVGEAPADEMYINHAFGGETATWEQMTKDDFQSQLAWFYTGTWGGSVSMFNTTASETGATTVVLDDTQFIDEAGEVVEQPAVGTANCQFIFIPANVGSLVNYPLVVMVPATTSLENTAAESKAVKLVEGGKIVIIKNGIRYNALGVKL